MNQSNKRRSGCRTGCGIFFLLILLLVLFFAYKGWRLYQTVDSLQTHQEELQALVDGSSPREMDMGQTAEILRDVRSDVVALQDESSLFTQIGAYVGFLPKVGGLAVSSAEFIEIADAGTHAMEQMIPHLQTVQDAMNSAEPLPALLNFVNDTQPEFSVIDLELTRINKAYQRIDNWDDLPWQIQELQSAADQYLPLATEGLRLLDIAPDLLGADGTPRTYLVLAQNRDELRANGGFISGAGIMQFQNGSVLNSNFISADYVNDNWRKNSELYDWPTRPLFAYMGLQYFFMRDANYWPHFPQSAETMIPLYEAGMQPDMPIDGVIAFNLEFVTDMFRVTGPIKMDGFDEPVSTQNVQRNIIAAWESSGNEDVAAVFARKDFLSTMAASLQIHLTQNLGDLDLVELANVLDNSTRVKDLIFYSRDEQTQEKFEKLGWSSDVPQDMQDQLFLVDNNFGYNKSNSVVEQDISYTVDLRDEDDIRASLEIAYQNNSRSSDECIQYQDYGELEVRTYEVISNRCHYNYLRVYVPENSQLISSSSHPFPQEWMTTANYVDYNWNDQRYVYDGAAGIDYEVVSDGRELQLFDHFFVVSHGETLTAAYEYRLPETVLTSFAGEKEYQLDIVKQSGARPHKTEVEVVLPNDATLISAEPEPTLQQSGILIWKFPLEEDSQIVITYK